MVMDFKAGAELATADLLRYEASRDCSAHAREIAAVNKANYV